MKLVPLSAANSLTYNMEDALINHIMNSQTNKPPVEQKKPIIDPDKWKLRDDLDKLKPYSKQYPADKNGTGVAYEETVREVGYLEVVLGKVKRPKKKPMNTSTKV